MENRLTISEIAGLMADSTGRSKRSCEDFLKEFFRLAADTLAEGENLRIKGFGNFKISDVDARASVDVSTGERTEIAAYKKVVFSPAKEMASLINSAFDIFESVELEDETESYSVEDLETESEEATSSEKEVEDQSEPTVPSEGVETEEAAPGYELKAGSTEEAYDDEISTEAYANGGEATPEVYQQPEVTPEVVYIETPSRFGRGVLVGVLSALVVCLTVFMIGCFFNWWPVNFEYFNSKNPTAKEETVTMPSEETSEPFEEVQEEVEPVYDTVTTTRYLTTIAREHYGNFNFWPYIYIENESILRHPDRITPGTKVVVPSLEKYGVDPRNKEDIEKAKKKAAEIYAKFK